MQVNERGKLLCVYIIPNQQFSSELAHLDFGLLLLLLKELIQSIYYFDQTITTTGISASNEVQIVSIFATSPEQVRVGESERSRWSHTEREVQS